MPTTLTGVSTKAPTRNNAAETGRCITQGASGPGGRSGAGRPNRGRGGAGEEGNGAAGSRRPRETGQHTSPRRRNRSPAAGHRQPATGDG